MQTSRRGIGRRASFGFVALLAVWPRPGHAQSFNLGFEERGLVNPGQAAGWAMSAPGFRAWRDTAVFHSGQASLAIARNDDGNSGFAAGGRELPLEQVRGRKLHLSGWVRAQDVSPGWAGFWLRVDGANRRTLFLDNMMLHGATGTRDWARYETTVLVDTAAVAVFVGPLLSGRGTAWYDDLSFDVDGQPLDLEHAAAWQPSPAELAWARKAAIPFTTERAGSGLDDLKPLAGLVGDARIVALGEGTHGTAEYFRMKHRLTEYLANRHGFTVFAIEANMPEARRVNEYVLTGKGDPAAALGGLYFWTWNTREVLDMIEWMRAYNASGRGRIEFWGFDMQYPMVALDSVRAFVARSDPTYSQAFDSAYAIVAKGYFARMRAGGVNSDVSAWRAAADGVLAHLEKLQAERGAAGDTLDLAWAVQNARVVLQAAQALRQGDVSRDSSMAVNVGWILRHRPAGTRIVLWAHNGHVQKLPGSMGGYLDHAFPGQMRVFGFGAGGGRYTAIAQSGLGQFPLAPPAPGSYESAFRALGLPRFILDLRPATTVPAAGWLKEPHTFRTIGAGAMDAQFFRTTLATAFDAVIYFDSTTPAIQLQSTPAAAAAAGDTRPDHLPPGWKQGSPQQPSYYRVDVDTVVRHGGAASGYLAARGSISAGLGALVQKLRADAYRGKRVRFSAWLRTRAAWGGAGLHIRAAGNDKALDEADSGPRLEGTGDWTRVQVVLDVPADADELFVRAYLNGPGALWLDDVALDVVGPDVPAMNSHRPQPYMATPEVKAWWGPLAEKLVNPDFEARAGRTGS